MLKIPPEENCLAWNAMNYLTLFCSNRLCWIRIPSLIVFPIYGKYSRTVSQLLVMNLLPFLPSLFNFVCNADRLASERSKLAVLNHLDFSNFQSAWINIENVFCRRNFNIILAKLKKHTKSNVLEDCLVISPQIAKIYLILNYSGPNMIQ